MSKFQIILFQKKNFNDIKTTLFEDLFFLKKIKSSFDKIIMSK